MTGYDWDQIRSEYPINVEIERHIDLKKRGREFVGLCPFHPDRKPSFQVIPEKGFAFCPSCGWHGDVVKFVSDYQKLGTAEAVAYLTGGKITKETEEEKARRRRSIEVREQQEAEEKAKRTASAKRIWENARPADNDHPYLVKKGVDGSSIRQDDDLLVLPVFNSDGEIQSIQTIDAEGKKSFHTGAPMSNGRMYIGISWDGPSVLCEGYATGKSINDATGLRVIVTYSMGNMEKVARSMVADGQTIMLAADTGTSATKMAELADELGIAVAIPTTKKGTDFNDQFQEDGEKSVKDVFDRAISDYDKKCKVKEITPESSIYRADGDDYPFDISDVNLTEPPGFAGELTDWIESQSRRPRRIISTASALTALGNVAGLRFIDARDGTTSNLFAFCIAGSRTGKESANQAVSKIHRAAGIAGATHGSIKSEQEIVKNLVRHQSALYVVDEIGDLLMKIKNAQKRGGAIYLDGVIAMLMSAYSKTDGYMLLTGDMKEQMRADLTRELSMFSKRLDDADGREAEFVEAKIALCQRQLANLDNGLEKPFLSMMGFTTPVAFDQLVDYQAATNGFIGRSLIFNERDTAPRSKVLKGFRKPDMPMGMEMRLYQLAWGAETGERAIDRVEYYGERVEIECDDEADEMLEQALSWFEDQAVAHKSSSGLESLYLGAYELVSKLSLVLAIPDGIKRAEHVRWAFAAVVRDVDEKVRLVTANDRATDAPMLAMQARLVNLCGSDEGETEGVLYNRLRPKKKDEIDEAIADLIKKGALERIEVKHKFNKRVVSRLRTKKG